ncbi:MAG: hypothetical protein H6642_13485 [Caldilineaceae bacterium]|nr:hypothetical protein [Caldilineaceae bacterium]
MSRQTESSYLAPDLSSFDAQVRKDALARYAKEAADPAPKPAADRVANMHCHSFFSYNALGLSPSALAVMAREEDIDLLGLVDFDVLDGVDEFLDACALLGVRGGASMETRLYVPEFADREINSPGEPGVLYHMGIGFTAREPDPSVAPLLADLADRARMRNEALVTRVNEYLAPVTVNYELDVLPLTPSGNATERHIIMAYLNAVEAYTDDPVAFWADHLGVSRSEVEDVLDVPFGLVNLIRKLLMKRGGAAYIQPGPETFPHVEEVHCLIIGCGALPCITWLDGTSAGEQALPELMDLLMGKGAVALNIIPDRNWNISHPETKRIKLQNLYAAVRLAEERDLPVIVGTEMNSPGQPLADQFDAPELEPVRGTFIDGAHFLYGHTALARHAGIGYQSDWAAEHLLDRAKRNAFYTEVGRRLPPGAAGAPLREKISSCQTPTDILALLAQ